MAVVLATMGGVLRGCNSGGALAEQLKIWGAVALKLCHVSYFVLWPKLFFLIFYFLGPHTKFRIFHG